jgi:hypothetical protein
MAKKKKVTVKKPVPTQNQMIWLELEKRITHTISREDFNTVCKLHAEEFKHKYYKFCTCNKKLLRQWLGELNDKLSIK